MIRSPIRSPIKNLIRIPSSPNLILSPVSTLVATINEATGNIELIASEVFDAESYNYYYKIGDGDWQVAITGEGITYTFVPIESGEYIFAVTAVKGSLETSKTVFVLTDYVILSPDTVTAAIDETSGGILLTASEVTGADSYSYYVSIDGGSFTEIATGQGTTYTYTPTEAGSYSFGVTAVNGSSESAMTTTAASGLFSDVPDSEGIALMAFYEAMNGDNWTDNTNWMTDSTVGNWYGVTVAGSTVTQLELPSNNLSGAVGTTLDSLTLTALDLTGNTLTGKILIADPGDTLMATADGAAAIKSDTYDLSGYTSHLIKAIDSSGNEAEAYGYQADGVEAKTELVTNGDNEADVATLVTQSTFECTVSQSTDFARNGSYSAKVTQNAGEPDDFRWQLNDPEETLVTEGKVYKVSVYGYNPSTNSGDKIRVDVFPNQLLGVVSSITDAWVEFGGYFTLLYPPSLRLFGWSSTFMDGDAVYWDDISFAEVTALGTTALQLRSTSDGSTRNLTSKDAGFNPNNIATIEIEAL